MELLFINVAVLTLFGAPLLLLDLLRGRWAWLNQNHHWLAIAVWLAMLATLRLVVLPKLGLEVNPAFDQ